MRLNLSGQVVGGKLSGEAHNGLVEEDVGHGRGVTPDLSIVHGGGAGVGRWTILVQNDVILLLTLILESAIEYASSLGKFPHLKFFNSFPSYLQSNSVITITVITNSRGYNEQNMVHFLVSIDHFTT